KSRDRVGGNVGLLVFGKLPQGSQRPIGEVLEDEFLRLADGIAAADRATKPTEERARSRSDRAACKTECAAEFGTRRSAGEATHGRHRPSDGTAHKGPARAGRLDLFTTKAAVVNRRA